MDPNGGVRSTATSRAPHRAADSRALERFLRDVRSGARALVVEGEAGIGKSTLVGHAIEQAAAWGFDVAVSRIDHLGPGMSFAALGDLLSLLSEDDVARLPPPQREALEVSLLRAPGGSTPPDPRAVGLAVLNTLRGITVERPLLVVLDDVQWIDQSSADVISFVLRRLDAEPVGVVATHRRMEGAPAGIDFQRIMTPDRVASIELQPLTIEEMAAILRERLPAELPRPVLVQIHDVVRGNPFFALQVGAEVLRRGVPEPGSPLPVPDDARRLVADRISSLPDATRRTLAVIAATSAATLDLLGHCVPENDVLADVEEGERRGLLAYRGEHVTFEHPILASAVLMATPPPDLREIHRSIAAFVADPETRARHLALSKPGRDGEIADALEEASVRARARGAASSAAELSLMAWDRTPVADRIEHSGRIVEAAFLAFESGDAPRAHELLEQAIDSAPSAPVRAQALVTATELVWQDTVRVEALATQALEQDGCDPITLAAARCALAWAFMYRGELERAHDEAREALDLVAGTDGPGALPDALTIAAVIDCLRGRPYRADLKQAVHLTAMGSPIPASEGGTVYSSPQVMSGLLGMWEGDFELAGEVLRAELDRCETQGRYVARDEILCYLAHLECRIGDWPAAVVHAEESLEIGAESGHPRGRGQNIVPRAWAAALLGDMATARTLAAEGLELSLGYQDCLAVANNRGVLGFIALSEDRCEEAVAFLEPVVDFLRGARAAEPGAVPFVADAVEALVATGRIDDAQLIVDDDLLTGRSSPGLLLTGSVLRASALVLAARGDLEGAAARLDSARDSAELMARPFERARALLALGDVRRRQKRRGEAREHLAMALDLFGGLGAVLWSRRAQEALARVTASSPPEAVLTPTEARLALLIREGKTNREAAERMFLSVKTVEGNLTRIYRKLQVRSRSELVHLLDTGMVPGLG